MTVITWKLSTCSLLHSHQHLFLLVLVLLGVIHRRFELLWLFTPQAFLCLCPSGLVSDARVRIPTTRDQQTALLLFVNMSAIKMENIKAA